MTKHSPFFISHFLFPLSGYFLLNLQNICTEIEINTSTNKSLSKAEHFLGKAKLDLRPLDIDALEQRDKKALVQVDSNDMVPTFRSSATIVNVSEVRINIGNTHFKLTELQI